MSAKPTERDHAVAVMLVSNVNWLDYSTPQVERHAYCIAQALADERARTIEEAKEVVNAVACRFRANHDPMSENAADDCYAAVCALDGTEEGA